MVPGADFNGVQSAVMAQTGQPSFVFSLFDLHNFAGGYIDRTNELLHRYNEIVNLGYAEAKYLLVIEQEICYNHQELRNYWQKCIQSGYEGAIAAMPHGLYKNGRSGLKEQLLLKLKAWHDDEAIVIEVKEEVAEDGTLKGRAGALWVRHASGAEFGVAGFDDIAKATMWINRHATLGKTITFKYQDWPAGGNPRFPGFKGFRHD
jgi:ATP-dependent DNA ligase